jgi:hypothetical protein
LNPASSEVSVTIEIQQPELEALIQRRMESGRFATVEDALLEALLGSPEPEPQLRTKLSLGQFLRESPLWGSGLEIERSQELPRMIDFE